MYIKASTVLSTIPPTLISITQTIPLHKMYAEKAIFCRGNKPTGLWKSCNTEKPLDDDLSIIEPNPTVD